MSGVKMSKMVEKMNLKNLTPDIDMTENVLQYRISTVRLLQLTGYFDHFDSERVQVIGYVEYTYLPDTADGTEKKIYKQLLSYKIPCLVFTTEIFRMRELLKQANETDTLYSPQSRRHHRCNFRLIDSLAECELAPCISIHGVWWMCMVLAFLLWGKRYRQE